MRNQRGIVLMGYLYIAAAVAFLGMFAAVKIQSSRLAAVKAEYASFVVKVKAAGDEQERKTKERIAKETKAKQEADRENETSRTRIATLSRQLRDARAGSRFVPPAPAGSTSPASVTYNRAELEREIQRLDSGVSGLLAEGDKTVTDFNTALKWATEIRAK